MNRSPTTLALPLAASLLLGACSALALRPVPIAQTGS